MSNLKFNVLFKDVFVWIILILSVSIIAADKPCIRRKFNHNSVVCVCNATYCDEISKVNIEHGKYILYSSSMSGNRLKKKVGSMEKDHSRSDQYPNFIPWLRDSLLGDTILEINRKKTYQVIFGFGGAFTDAAGINIFNLSSHTQENLINSYFSEKGIEYNIGRVPIGGTDFSTHPYAYNMEPENDKNLTNFTLSPEDFKYKIPLIHKAKKVATSEMHFIGAAWSPPVWMKTNHAYGGSSRLLPEYYQPWADYHVKFLREYIKNDITFWAISTGNEPSNGIIPYMKFNSLGWTPKEQALWVSDNLGPTIRNSEFSDLFILALDDQRFSLPWWIELMANNKKAMEYLDGVAVHWYWDDIFPPINVDKTISRYPKLFIISTEACVGDKPWQFEKVELGSWNRAEMYIRDIIEDMNHWHSGWVDWNLALNKVGGPNWVGNYVDSPIIVLPESDEFLKQPMFYALGHFSKFIPRNSKKIHTEKISGNIDHVAFMRPDGAITVVFYNPFDSEKKIVIQEDGIGYVKINVPSRSVHTLIYR